MSAGPAVPRGVPIPDGPVLLATRNRGKLRELHALFAAMGVSVVTLDAVGLVEEAAEADLEAFPTFAENALAKARHFYARLGGVVLAEDSGLCVAALDGAPGVHSKRWGAPFASAGVPLDETNITLLLERLSGVPARDAHYACTAALVWDGGALVADGRTHGRILERRSGEGGFGYDPVFWSAELEGCFATVSPAAKASVSHRSRAIRRVWEAAGPRLRHQLPFVDVGNSGRPVDPSRGAM